MEPVVHPYPIEEITIVHNGRRLKQLKLNKARTKIVIRTLPGTGIHVDLSAM